jgi:hypothetical protein
VHCVDFYFDLSFSGLNGPPGALTCRFPALSGRVHKGIADSLRIGHRAALFGGFHLFSDRCLLLFNL